LIFWPFFGQRIKNSNSTISSSAKGSLFWKVKKRFAKNQKFEFNNFEFTENSLSLENNG